MAGPSSPGNSDRKTNFGGGTRMRHSGGCGPNSAVDFRRPCRGQGYVFRDRQADAQDGKAVEET